MFRETFEMMGFGWMAGLFAAFFIIGLLFFAAAYVYTALALMKTAKRLKAKQAWLAWIPVGNLVLMSRMAKMPWWPVLLLIGALIPWIGLIFAAAVGVFAIIWMYKICEARKRPGWWAILVAVSIIPGVGILGCIWGLVLIGILAWAKK